MKNSISNPEPQDILETLMERAKRIANSGCPHAENIRHCIKNGHEIPDHYLPGRMVMALSDDEREILRKLKSSDIAHMIL